MRKKRNEREPSPALINLDAERAVLGCCLRDEAQYLEVADLLTPEDFSDIRHARIFKAMQALAAAGRPIVRQTIPQVIGDEEQDEIGLAAYLPALIHDSSGDVRAVEFADSVLHASARRRALAELDRARDELMSAPISTTPDEIADMARQAFDKIVPADMPSGIYSYGEVSRRVVKDTADLWRDERTAGIRTGLRFVDELLGPMLPGDLIVIGGATSAGKTALATQIGYSVASGGCEKQEPIPVGFSSLEQSSVELVIRMLSKAADIASEKIVDAALNQSEMERLIHTGESVRNIPLFLDERENQTATMIGVRASRMKKRNSIGLHIIDHLHFIRPEDPKREERERISDSTKILKAVAKRLQIPIILLAHMNRYVDTNTIRSAKDIRRPSLSSLFGSSDIEKVADAVIFVHRPEYWLELAKPDKSAAHYGKWEEDFLKWSGRAEIVLAKRRMRKGRGIRQCMFDEKHTWFNDDVSTANAVQENFTL